METDRRLAPIAAGQRGLLTHGQASAAGMSAEAVKRRLRTGRWEPCHEGVYRIAGSPRSWGQDILAACLAARPDAVVSHRSAARLWGLDGFEEDVVEVTVARPLCHRLTRVIVHRSTDIARTVPASRDGLFVTNPMRTLIDLGAVVRPRLVERALDHAVGRRLVTLGGVRRELESVARRGRRGAGVMRALLEERCGDVGVPDSVLEARMLRICRDHSLPMPICQFEVRLGRRLLGRVDFAFPELRLAMEVDGYERHASLEAFQHDRARQNDLVAAGWTVLRFTWDDVRQRPEWVAGAILRVLGALRVG